jgi:hypothetical protein
MKATSPDCISGEWGALPVGDSLITVRIDGIDNGDDENYLYLQTNYQPQADQSQMTGFHNSNLNFQTHYSQSSSLSSVD